MRRHLPRLKGSPEGADARQVDAARRRLGGRGQSEPGVGQYVALGGDPHRLGVVLFVAGTELDVWTGEGRVQRMLCDRARFVKAPDTGELAALAADIQVFARLTEGTRVRYVDAGELSEATLVEKCRYGALVRRDDARIMAIGFRKLHPVSIGPFPS
jgi:hypothetical protein